MKGTERRSDGVRWRLKEKLQGASEPFEAQALPSDKQLPYEHRPLAGQLVVRVLYDSGAKVNALNCRVWQGLQPHTGAWEVVETGAVVIRDVQRRRVEVAEVVETDLDLPGAGRVRLRFYVLEGIKEDCIVGAAAMRKHALFSHAESLVVVDGKARQDQIAVAAMTADGEKRLVQWDDKDEEALAEFEAKAPYRMTEEPVLRKAITEVIRRRMEVFGPMAPRGAKVEPMPIELMPGSVLRATPFRRVSPPVREAPAVVAPGEVVQLQGATHSGKDECGV
jgi:hypothetical protein